MNDPIRLRNGSYVPATFYALIAEDGQGAGGGLYVQTFWNLDLAMTVASEKASDGTRVHVYECKRTGAIEGTPS